MKWTYRPHTQASVTMTIPMAAARDRRCMGPRFGKARAMPARGVWKVSAAGAGVCAPGPSRIRARRACVGRAVVRTIICAPDVACGGAGERVPNRAASVDGPLRAGVDSALRLSAVQPSRPRMCVYWVVTVLCKRTRGAHEGKRPEARRRAGREASAAGGTAPGRSSASAGAQAGGQRGGKRPAAVPGCAPVRRLPARQPALRPAACGER